MIDPLSGVSPPDDHAEERGLADAVGADDADDAVTRQVERQPFHEQPVAEALGEVLGGDHRGAQARARRDLDLFEVQLAVLVGFGRHLLVALEAGLALGLAGLRVGPHPLQLVLQALLALDVLLPFDLEPRGLGLQVGGVVALVGVGAPPVELQDPGRDVVEEVAVVGHGQDGAGVFLQVLLQPLDALGVEVVGGLVQQQQVGGLQQQLAQGDATALTTGQHGHVGVGRRATQCVHRLLELAVEVPRVAVLKLVLQLAHLLQQRVAVVGGHLLGDVVVALEHRHRLGDAFLHVAEDVLLLVERGLLLEHAHGEARHQFGVAVGRVLQAGHHPEQRRLSGAVRPEDADLGAWQERQRDVVKNDLVTMSLADALQRVDVLRHGI